MCYVTVTLMTFDKQSNGRRTRGIDHGGWEVLTPWKYVSSINNSVSVDLGVCNPGAIGNNDLVVAVQR